jgi:hypothetical protein
MGNSGVPRLTGEEHRYVNGMDGKTIEEGFRELDLLIEAEYHQSLTEVLAETDKSKVAERLGRLVGVLIKKPFADSQDLSSASYLTGAYRSWHLKTAADFDVIAATNPWQYQLLDRIRSELNPGRTTYQLAEDAQSELGFFGLYAEALRRYICGDKEIRKTVDDAFRAYAKMGGSVKAPTPEGLVGAGGLALGAYLVQAVPVLGMAGAPAIAGVVLILYVLGVKTFCEWSNGLRTNETEKN